MEDGRTDARAPGQLPKACRQATACRSLHRELSDTKMQQSPHKVPFENVAGSKDPDPASPVKAGPAARNQRGGTPECTVSSSATRVPVSDWMHVEGLKGQSRTPLRAETGALRLERASAQSVLDTRIQRQGSSFHAQNRERQRAGLLYFSVEYLNAFSVIDKMAAFASFVKSNISYSNCRYS